MQSDIHYESEIEDILLSQSKNQYGIKNETELIHYLFRRYWIVNLDETRLPRIKKEEFPLSFMRFWLSDLAIPCKNNQFIYKNITFSSNAIIGSPLRNIFENLLHQLSTHQILYHRNYNHTQEYEIARKEVNQWLKEGKRKNMKYAKHKEIYPFYLKQFLLEKLNKMFQAKPQLPSKIEGFVYSEEVIQLSEEEICNRYLQAFQNEVKDGELLPESELEQYVIKHLEKVESGLRLIKSQYVLPNGRIDILAKDSKGNYVVIELKVEKDTDILYQQWYYCKEVKKQFYTNNVRFIAILPQFYPDIIESLLESDTPTTILQFHPIIQRGKLKKVTFTQYKQ